MSFVESNSDEFFVLNLNEPQLETEKSIDLTIKFVKGKGLSVADPLADINEQKSAIQDSIISNYTSHADPLKK